MVEIQFDTVITDDRVIHLPSTVKLAPGPVHVILKPQRNGAPVSGPREPIAERLARFAEAHPEIEMPGDIARNHDHYAHGAPKGLDEQ